MKAIFACPAYTGWRKGFENCGALFALTYHSPLNKCLRDIFSDYSTSFHSLIALRVSVWKFARKPAVGGQMPVQDFLKIEIGLVEYRFG